MKKGADIYQPLFSSGYKDFIKAGKNRRTAA